MVGRRSLVAVSASLLLALGTGTPPAHASAPPDNDLLANATVIPSIPFTDVVDTTGATSDADDVQAMGFCEFPGMGNSVWYSYTTTDQIQLVVDAYGTAYRTGVGIAVGTPGNLTMVSCTNGGGRIRAGISSGTTVSIVLVDTLGSGGGDLAVSIYAPSAPANDTIGGATPIPSLPFTDVVDTLRATTDADDEQVNRSCGLPSTENSVWYSFTAGPADTSVLFGTPDSTYHADVIVATGSPGALTTLGCGSFGVIAPTTPGTTYYVLVSSPSLSGGGRLVLKVIPTPPPAAIRVHVKGAGTVDGQGVVHLSGKYRCSNAESAAISGDARRRKRLGFFSIPFDDITCDGHSHRWRRAVHDDRDLRFRPGYVRVQAFGQACNPAGCDFSFHDKVVKLVRA